MPSKALINSLNEIPMTSILELFKVDYEEGRNFKCCYTSVHPGATGKTPSMRFYPKTNSLGCFGCRHGGGPINSVMYITGKDFNESCKFLMEKFNIEDTSNSYSTKKLLKRYELKQTVYEADLKVSYITNYCKECEANWDDKLKVFMLLYLTKEFFSAEDIYNKCCEAKSILESSGDIKLITKEYEFFIRHLMFNNDLLKLGQRTPEVLKFLSKRQVNTNLIQFSKEGIEEFDFETEFSGQKDRLIFPIIMPPFYTIGFSGRAQGDFLLKYLTQFSFELHKSDTLYGLEIAYKHILEHDKVIVVEGIVDVLRFYTFGVYFVVSTNGAELSKYQFSLLHMFTDNIILGFDGDDGGEGAYKRACKDFETEDFKFKKFICKQDYDPDDFGKLYPEEFKEELSKFVDI